MQKKILSILKKIYSNENRFYNDKISSIEHKIPPSISEADLNLLEANGLKPNNFETFEHDELLEKFFELRANKKLTLDFCTSMFIKGVTGEMPRGRQTLMSYIYLKHMYDHPFEGGDSCEICGLPKKKTIDQTGELYSYYLGHSWSEGPLGFFIELNEILNFEAPVITKEDKKILSNLIKLIQQAEPNETPGNLEQRLAKGKVLSQTDKYKRYGILLTLAEAGILPNDYIKPLYEAFYTRREMWAASENLKTSHRSDIVLPFGGWKGKNGVDFKRYEEIFANY